MGGHAHVMLRGPDVDAGGVGWTTSSVAEVGEAAWGARVGARESGVFIFLSGLLDSSHGFRRLRSALFQPG